MKDRQHEIILTFEQNYDLVLKKSEIIEKGQINYTHNASNWVGKTLSRMIKNGSLTRVKTGYYRLGGTVDTGLDQIDMFNN